MEEFGDVARHIAFHDCQANFYNAASNGLRASLHWLNGQIRPADELVLFSLPLAARGLTAAGVDEDDVNRLLDLIGDRVKTGQTGSRWMLQGYNQLRAVVPKNEALQGLVRAYLSRQRSGIPVHEWVPTELPDRSRRHAAYQKVGQIMQTDLITVNEQDTVTLAEAMMRWEKIRHVPVENSDGELVGIFSLSDLVRALRRRESIGESSIQIGEVMSTSLRTVTPETPTLEAIRILREEKLSALPVIQDSKLVGIITDRDFLVIAARLLE